MIKQTKTGCTPDSPDNRPSGMAAVTGSRRRDSCYCDSSCETCSEVEPQHRRRIAGHQRLINDATTCTSCPPPPPPGQDGPTYGIALLWHQYMAGRCLPYDTRERVFCGTVAGNERGSIFDERGTICTKTVQTKSVLRLTQWPDEIMEHFGKAQGYDGLAYVKCNIRKETVCERPNNSLPRCHAKKAVVCAAVCKPTNGNFLAEENLEDECFADLCSYSGTKKWSLRLCDKIAMMA